MKLGAIPVTEVRFVVKYIILFKTIYVPEYAYIYKNNLFCGLHSDIANGFFVNYSALRMSVILSLFLNYICVAKSSKSDFINCW